MQKKRILQTKDIDVNTEFDLIDKIQAEERENKLTNFYEIKLTKIMKKMQICSEKLKLVSIE